MDAGSFVELAQSWKSVPEHHTCLTKVITDVEQYRIIHGYTALIIDFELDNSCYQYVEKLEHVIVILSVDFHTRGDLIITVTSPSGTESNILNTRPHDTSNEGFTDFKFLTVHLWDENWFFR